MTVSFRYAVWVDGKGFLSKAAEGYGTTWVMKLAFAKLWEQEWEALKVAEGCGGEALRVRMEE